MEGLGALGAWGFGLRQEFLAAELLFWGGEDSCNMP